MKLWIFILHQARRVDGIFDGDRKVEARTLTYGGICVSARYPSKKQTIDTWARANKDEATTVTENRRFLESIEGLELSAWDIDEHTNLKRLPGTLAYAWGGFLVQGEVVRQALEEIRS